MRKLLEGPVHVRRGLARWILLLEELGRFAAVNGRTWVTREDWIEHGARGRPTWADALERPWENSAPKKDLERCQEWLHDHGTELVLETLELRDGGLQHRLYVGTLAIAALIEPEVRDARIVDECATAKREKRAPQLDWLDSDPPVLNLQSDYQVEKKPFSLLRKKHGIGHDRLRKLLLRSKTIELRKPGRMRISEKVGPERTARALRVHDQGGSLEDVRRELGLATKCSAWRFLKRHGRDTKPREKRAPPEAPPATRMLTACERSATCA